MFDTAVVGGDYDHNPESNPENIQPDLQDAGGPAGGEAPAGGDVSAQSGTDVWADIFQQDLNEVLITNTPDLVTGPAGSGDADGGGDVRVLVISSGVQDADALASAAANGVITVVYDGDADSPDAILAKIDSALDGKEADSIAFAVHDMGGARFHLTGGYSVSPSTLVGNNDLRAFW